MQRLQQNILLLLALLLVSTGMQPSLYAQAQATATVGMATETRPAQRADRLIQFMEQEVADQKLVGGVNLVYHKGKMVHQRTFGYKDLETKEPFPMDGIFFIQSMTKPIVTVGIMMLYEEGHFELDDPVSQYLPYFAEQEIAQFAGPNETGKMTTIPAQNPITIRQLLSHTSGKRHGIFGSELDKIYLRKLYIMPHKTIEDRVEAFATCPLQVEPGTAWLYSASPDVLAVLIEKFSGMSCEAFLQQRIFDPLGMKDTGYNLSKEAQSRMITLHSYDKDGKLEVAARQTPMEKNTVFAGANALFSSAGDYMKFAQMLLYRGTYNGQTLLSPKTVELMTRNHVGELYPEPGLGFGLGFAVVTDVAKMGALGSEGTFFWNGAYNTYFFVDPAEELISVFMMQTAPYNGYYERKHRHFIYQSLTNK